MDSLGKRLRAARGKLSQSDLAAQVGVAHNTLSRWERDQQIPDANSLAAICSKLSISPAWMLLGEGDMHGGPAPSRPVPDKEILRSALEAVEEGLRVTRRTLPPDKKAALIMAAYDLIEESGSAGKVIELIRIVA